MTRLTGDSYKNQVMLTNNANQPHDDSNLIVLDKLTSVIGTKRKKMHECAFCLYRTPKKNDLQRHTMAVHFAEKSFKCDTCNVRKNYIIINISLII